MSAITLLAIIVGLIFIAIIIFVCMGDDDFIAPPREQYKTPSQTQHKGKMGEELVKARGEELLAPEIYIPFHNLTIYNGEKTVQIDHLYLSIYGIFVVETKHYGGWIYGNQYHAIWTQTFSQHQKYEFKNPIRQNYGHMKFLENFLTIDFNKFHSVIVFSGNGILKTPMPDNVCQLGNFCEYILSFNKPIFTQQEVERLSKFLHSKLLPRTDHALTFHVHHIQNH